MLKQLTQGDRAKKQKAEVELESISPDSKSKILSIPSHDGTERYILSNTDLCKLTFKKSEVHQFVFVFVFDV